MIHNVIARAYLSFLSLHFSIKRQFMIAKVTSMDSEVDKHELSSGDISCMKTSRISNVVSDYSREARLNANVDLIRGDTRRDGSEVPNQRDFIKVHSTMQKNVARSQYMVAYTAENVRNDVYTQNDIAAKGDDKRRRSEAFNSDCDQYRCNETVKNILARDYSEAGSNDQLAEIALDSADVISWRQSSLLIKDLVECTIAAGASMCQKEYSGYILDSACAPLLNDGSCTPGYRRCEISASLNQTDAVSAMLYASESISFSVLASDITGSILHIGESDFLLDENAWWLVLVLPRTWQFDAWVQAIVEIQVTNAAENVDYTIRLPIRTCYDSIGKEICIQIGRSSQLENYGIMKLGRHLGIYDRADRTSKSQIKITTSKCITRNPGEDAAVTLLLVYHQEGSKGPPSQIITRQLTPLHIFGGSHVATPVKRSLSGTSIDLPEIEDSRLKWSLLWIEQYRKRLTISFSISAAILFEKVENVNVCVNFRSKVCSHRGPQSRISVAFPDPMYAAYTRYGNPFVSISTRPDDLNLSIVSHNNESFCISNLLPGEGPLRASMYVDELVFQIRVKNVVTEVDATSIPSGPNQLPLLGLIELTSGTTILGTDCPQVIFHQQSSTTYGLSAYSVMSIIMYSIGFVGSILITRMNGLSFSRHSFFNDMTAASVLITLLLGLIANAIWVTRFVQLNASGVHVYFIFTIVQSCAMWTLLTAVCCHWTEVLRADNRDSHRVSMLVIFSLANLAFYAGSIYSIIALASFITCTYSDYVQNPTYDKRMCGNDFCPDLQPLQWNFAVEQVCRDVPYSTWFFPIILIQNICLFAVTCMLLFLGMQVLRRGTRLAQHTETFHNNTQIHKVMQKSLKKFVAVIYAVWMAWGIRTVTYLYLYTDDVHMHPVPWYILAIWIPLIVPPCALILLQWNPRLQNLSWKQSIELTDKRMQTQVTTNEADAELDDRVSYLSEFQSQPATKKFGTDDEFQYPDAANYSAFYTPAGDGRAVGFENVIGAALKLLLPRKTKNPSQCYIELYAIESESGLYPSAPSTSSVIDQDNSWPTSRSLERSSISSLIESSLQRGKVMSMNNTSFLSNRASFINKSSQWKKVGLTESVQPVLHNNSCYLAQFSTILQMPTDMNNPYLRFVVYEVIESKQNASCTQSDTRELIANEVASLSLERESRPKLLGEFSSSLGEILGGDSIALILGGTARIVSKLDDTKALDAAQLRIETMTVSGKTYKENGGFYITKCFQFGNKNEMVVEDMLESVLTNEIPIQYLQILRKERKEDLAHAKADLREFIERCRTGLASGLWDNVIDQIQDENDQSAIQSWLEERVQKRAAYVVLLERCHQTSVKRTRDGIYFRQSTERKNVLQQFLPVNMHLQDMWVGPTEDLRSHRSRRVSDRVECYSFLTVGAFAAHSLGFRHGTGILGLEGKLSKLLNRQADVYLDTRTKIGASHKQIVDWSAPEVQQADEIKWHITTRMDACLSQALAALVASICHHVERAVQSEQHRLIILTRAGFLFQVESLLSTYGKELGMLEDFAAAVDMLKHVSFVLEFNNSDQSRATSTLLYTSMLNPHVKQVDLPWVSSVRVTAGASARSYIVTVAICSIGNIYENIPPTLCDRRPIPVIPVIFTQGINEMQTIANNSSGRKTLLQDAINRKSLIELTTYIDRYKEIAEDLAQITHVDLHTIDTLATELRDRIVLASKRVVKTKDPKIVQISARLCRLLSGSRVTSCKSAKDRTGMSVTLEQGQLLATYHHLPANAMMQAVASMRTSGVRLENAFKNTNKYSYAFKAIQRSMLPEEYRCPEGTYGRGNVS